MTRVRIAEEAEDRLAQRGGHVHGATVAADDLFANGKTGEEIR